MRKFSVFAASIVLSIFSYGQGQPVVDSLKKQLAAATTKEEKFDAMGRLSRVYMNINPVEAEKYGKELIRFAEKTRDRRLMIRAQLVNGERYSYLAGKRENIEKSMAFYNEGLALARSNKVDDLTVSAYLALSELHRYIPAPEKALPFCNQAYSYIGTIKNDSLTARVHLEYGMVYMATNDKLLSLRNIMAALRIAEEIKNPLLLRSAYSRLAIFYSNIEDFDKAIDYQVKSLDMLSEISSGQTPYNRITDLNTIGDLYAAKKNYDLANSYYEDAIRIADSMKFEPIKANSYRSIVNNFVAAKEPRKALEYFNSHPQLRNFLTNVGFGHFIDQSMGYIYMELGMYDSSKYHYNKVTSFFENDVNAGTQFQYYYQLGLLHQKTGELEKSLEYFLKANDIAKKVNNLQMLSVLAEQLDSVYQRQGDYANAIFYAGLNSKFKDSLNKLGKEKELMQVEATDEQQRQERVAREKEEKKKKRHSIQYLGITIGIAALFIILVMMGMFKVSVNTIKAIGFFVFLMFFEFIFLLFKKNIYSITQGEPWKDLLFMIALAAVLLPLHHWMEHRVIHFLTSHNRLTKAGSFFKSKFLRRLRGGDP